MQASKEIKLLTMSELVTAVNPVMDEILDKFKRCLQQPDYDVNAIDADGQTALMHAVRHVVTSNPETTDAAVNLEKIKLLLRHQQIDINTRSADFNCCTALHIACGYTVIDRIGSGPLLSTKAAEMLIDDERCDVNAISSDGKYAYVTVEQKRAPLIRIDLSQGMAARARGRDSAQHGPVRARAPVRA